METTAGFGSSKRFKNQLDRLSNGSLKWLYKERNQWRNFSTSEIRNVLACSLTTSDPMDKPALPLDLAHQRGPETPLHAILMIVESGGRGRRI
jgi:hypothetical protein